MQCDSSEQYYASIIWQLGENNEKRITHYFSHKWSPTQARHCINIKELLAIYYTIRRAEAILYGLSFTVLCDNQCAVNFLKTQNLSPQLSRVAEYLGSHRVTFSKMRGVEAAWADVISRDAPSSEIICKTECTVHNPCKECAKFSVNVCTLYSKADNRQKTVKSNESRINDTSLEKNIKLKKNKK